MYDTQEEGLRVILLGIQYDREPDLEEALNELEDLADTAGVEVVGRLTQKREKQHPAHYLGKGKIEELKDQISLLQANGVLCDDELSPAQQRNLSEILNLPVMDRTLLILDIFAAHAQSAEGKVQVELAQLKYRLSHLSGMGRLLSRQGGGIGTRGPGEKKLETDRRHIRERIQELNTQLIDIESHRRLLRENRSKEPLPLISLVGYTNAGKSSLMNALTHAQVLVEDKLFATLDTTTRRLTLPGGSPILCTDTVGFIQKLPHHLIQAFRATLEELHHAQILVHVIDAANPNRETQMAVVYQTLSKLSCEDQLILNVWNKMDQAVELPLPVHPRACQAVAISAKTGEGLEQLLLAIEDLLKSFRKKVALLIPFEEGRLVHDIHSLCEVVTEEYREDGIYMEIFSIPSIDYRIDAYKSDQIHSEK